MYDSPSPGISYDDLVIHRFSESKPVELVTKTNIIYIDVTCLLLSHMRLLAVQC